MIKKLVFIYAMLFSVNVCAVNWTATIKNVTVFPSGKAQIILKDLSSPNPSDNIWECTSSVALLGDPANSSLLSIALALYTTQKQVRIGVEGSGQNCFVSYISGL